MWPINSSQRINFKELKISCMWLPLDGTVGILSHMASIIAIDQIILFFALLQDERKKKKLKIEERELFQKNIVASITFLVKSVELNNL